MDCRVFSANWIIYQGCHYHVLEGCLWLLGQVTRLCLTLCQVRHFIQDKKTVAQSALGFGLSYRLQSQN